MAASRYTREMMARLLTAQPVRCGMEKMPMQGGIVISPKFRDRVVNMLMEGGECCECTDSLCATSRYGALQAAMADATREHYKDCPTEFKPIFDPDKKPADGWLSRLWRRIEDWVRG